MNLTPRQTKYIKTLKSLYNIHDAAGRVIKYDPLNYQIEAHIDSINCSDDPPHQIWDKARGPGATLNNCADILITAKLFDNLVIPFSSITAESGSVVNDWLWFLLTNQKK